MAAASLARVRLGQPPCEALGAAVHLGQGRFVTAAHVVDGVQAGLRGCAPTTAAPLVVFAGQAQPARVLRTGRADVTPDIGPRYLGGRDIALLQAAPGPAGPAATPCDVDAAPGAAVVVATPRRIVAARVLGRVQEAPAAYGAYAEIAIRLEPGESGAGVFDAAEGCLLGLVSHRDDARPGQTRIVLAETLRGFLAQPAAPGPGRVAGPARRW